MTADFDYSEYDETVADPGAGDNSLSALRFWARAQKDAELEVARLTTELSVANERLREISEEKLPELMDELGIPSFSTTDGMKITVREVIRASLGRTDEEKARAIKWLEDNGHGAIVKRTVEIPFMRDQETQAMELRKDLKEKGYPVSFDRRVENSTLRAFVTECLEAGEDIPLDIIKVHRDRRTKVEL